MNIEFLNKHFSSSSSQKTRKTVLKSFKIDFKSIFPMKPSQFGNVCTKFELDPSNENRAIKKIRWVGQIRPGPFKSRCAKVFKTVELLSLNVHEYVICFQSQK